MADIDRLAEWMHYADVDLGVAAHMMKFYWPTPTEIICYHCQQSAEKYLKAYLVSEGIEEPPRIHYLPTLRELCEIKDKRFSDIVEACDKLTRYAIVTRYPDEMEVTRKDAEEALKYAEEIKRFTSLAKIRESVESKYKENSSNLSASVDGEGRIDMLRRFAEHIGVSDEMIETAGTHKPTKALPVNEGIKKKLERLKGDPGGGGAGSPKRPKEPER
jgi:HEPN domain-containing protein